MIIARRVISGIVEHLPGRASEWALSAIIAGWGVILSLSNGLFEKPSYVALARIADQADWASLCAFAGIARIAALTINGTFANTWWSHYSPHVRASMAFIACFYWLTISLSVAGSDQLSTGLAVYPVLLFLDAYNVIRASIDARHSEEKYRNGRYS